MNKLSLIIFLVIATLSIPAGKAFGSDDDHGGRGGAGVPLDGGISMLLAAGVGYGVKKVKEQRKKSSQL